MLCIRCGADNFDDEAVCFKCGAALPRIPDVARVPTRRQGHLERLIALCEGYQQGIVTDEALLEVVENIEEKVAATVENLERVKIAELDDKETEGLLEEELSLSRTGAEMMLEALALISAGANFFERGLALAEEATDLLNRSIEVAHEIKRKLGVPMNRETEGLA
jgi:hypothetical protein